MHLLKGLIVMQFLNGNWETLIKMPSEKQDLTKEEIKETLDSMRTLIFDSEKVNIYTDREVVIFNRNDGPIKLIWGDVGGYI